MSGRGIDSEIVEGSYDRIALDYHGSRLAKTAKNAAFLDRFAVHYPKAGAMLDLGCGGGHPVTRYFYDRGLEVTGVDVSAAMLELAREAMPRATFTRGDMTAVDLPAASFDLVLSFFAIFHVPRVQHAGLFAKVCRWLQPGGLLFVTLGVEDCEAKSVEDWRGQPMYWSHFDATTNLAMLKDAGFEIIWRDIDRRPGDDDHLFVLATRSR